MKGAVGSCPTQTDMAPMVEGGRTVTPLLTYTLRGPISPSVPPKKIRFTPTAPPTTF